MDENRIVDLVILYCKDELSLLERQELQDWLRENEEHQKMFQVYLNQYRRTRKIVFGDVVDECVAWKKIKQRVVCSERRFGTDRYVRIVAVVVACVVLVGFAFYLTRDSLPDSVDLVELRPGMQKAFLKTSNGSKINLTDITQFAIVEQNGVKIEKNEDGTLNYKNVDYVSNEMLFNTIEVPRAGEYFLTLSDDTKVWLNAESELRFPIVFDSLQREVDLTGEAYFEVIKDRARPFIVKCKNREVRVLGTKFNVSAYENHRDMVTTLIEGSLEIVKQGSNCLLKPGQQAILGNGIIQVKEVDARIYAAWATGVFEFENRSLSYITEQLGRWYDVEFTYSSDEIKEITFTGAASRHRNLKFILNMIERLSNVKFVRNEDRIMVMDK